jgi:hypothetical protein
MLLAKELLQSLLAHVDARPASRALTQLNLTHDARLRAMDEIDAMGDHPNPPAPAQAPALDARMDAIMASLAALQTENQKLRELIASSHAKPSLAASHAPADHDAPDLDASAHAIPVQDARGHDAVHPEHRSPRPTALPPPTTNLQPR